MEQCSNVFEHLHYKGCTWLPTYKLLDVPPPSQPIICKVVGVTMVLDHRLIVCFSTIIYLFHHTKSNNGFDGVMILTKVVTKNHRYLAPKSITSFIFYRGRSE